MAAEKVTAAKKAAPAPSEKAPADSGEAQVQATFDVETGQGFRGVEVDQTPNEHYTLAGVLAGKPTPETAG